MLHARVGDILVMGTPSVSANARDPKIFMKPGDVCEVEISVSACSAIRSSRG